MTRQVSLVVAALAIGACDAPSGGDAGAPFDATLPDRPDPRDDATDAPRSRDITTADLPQGPRCNGVPVELLGAQSITVDTRASPASVGGGLQFPILCGFALARQRIFAYQTRLRAVLRVSTSSPNTDPFLDTSVVLVDSPCGATAASLLGCDDDEPTGGDGFRVSSTVVAARELAPGSVVQIAVGILSNRDTGTLTPKEDLGVYELSVEELVAATEGGPCDVARRALPCADGLACVPAQRGALNGICRPLGGARGGLCRPDGTCDAPLECSTAHRCVESAAPVGSLCDATRFCAADFACVPVAPGSPLGACRLPGSLGAPCRPGGGCEAGLACGDVCLRAASLGASCDDVFSACPEGQRCVSAADGGHRGACRGAGSVVGAACNDDSSPCAAPLVCAEGRCATRVAVGGACGTDARCAEGSRCVSTAPHDTRRGRCVADGAPGGGCRDASGARCDGSGSCEDGRCVRAVADGERCGDPGLSCGLTSSCVPGALGADARCRPYGQRGARCRVGRALCEPGLRCSATVPQRGICQAAATERCDAWSSSDRCPDGQVCLATSLSEGHCAAPRAEAEPDDSLSGLAPWAAPIAVRGSLTAGDLDCFALDVPANGRVFARATTLSGLCFGDLTLDLYRQTASGVEPIGSDGDGFHPAPFLRDRCPRIEGGASVGAFPWAERLAAGRYAVCLRATTDTRLDDYVLSLWAGP